MNSPTYKVGDLVVANVDGVTIKMGIEYTVIEVKPHAGRHIVRLTGGGISSRGWWIYESDVDFLEITEEDCRFCKSSCKNDNVCPFFMSRYGRD